MRRTTSFGAGTPSSAPVFVTLSGFFAYFEHRLRAHNLTAAAAVRPPPLFFGRHRRYPGIRRRRPSTPFVFIQHQPVASVAVIYPDFFDMAYSLCRSKSTHARCWQHRRVPSSMTCPRAWQAWCGASSTSSSTVYACPVLATPTRAFVYDVSPGLATPARRVVSTILLSGASLLRHHCAHD